MPEPTSAGADYVLDEESNAGTLLAATVVANGTGVVDGPEKWPRLIDRDVNRTNRLDGGFPQRLPERDRRAAAAPRPSRTPRGVVSGP